MTNFIDRQELLTWLGRGAPVEKLTTEGSAPKHGEILLLRAVGHDKDRPIVIVADENELADLLAFVSTYVSTFSPFSKFFRVMTHRDWRGGGTTKSVNSTIQRALTGSVICDSIPLSSDRTIDGVSVQDCLFSESFCMAKAFDAARNHDRSAVIERWTFCSRFLSRSNLQVNSTSLDFWRLIDAALGSNRLKVGSTQKTIATIILKLIDTGEFNDRVWREILVAYPFLEDVRDSMHGPRETRARAFSTIVRSDAVTGLGAQGDFVVGLLGTLLAGAQVEYSNLIDGLRPMFPNAPKWFGFITGCVHESDVLTAGRSLGRHILSELSRAEEFGEAILADISFEELRLAWGHKRGTSAFRAKNADTIAVSLFPDLTVAFKRAEDLPKRVSDAGMSEEQLLEARHLARRLGVLLDEAMRGKENGSESFSRRKPQKKLF